MAKVFIVIGLLLVAIGVALLYAPWLLSWFGKLPGDIRFESGRSKLFFPVTSMIIISVVLSVIISLFKR